MDQQSQTLQRHTWLVSGVASGSHESQLPDLENSFLLAMSSAHRASKMRALCYKPPYIRFSNTGVMHRFCARWALLSIWNVLVTSGTRVKLPSEWLNVSSILMTRTTSSLHMVLTLKPFVRLGKLVHIYQVQSAWCHCHLQCRVWQESSNASWLLCHGPTLLRWVPHTSEIPFPLVEELNSDHDAFHSCSDTCSTWGWLWQV